MNVTAYYLDETGGTYYAYPTNQSLADWTTHRVLLTEGTGANVGRYSATLDTDDSADWAVFAGSSQPASWSVAVEVIGLDTATAAAQAAAALAQSQTNNAVLASYASPIATASSQSTAAAASAASAASQTTASAIRTSVGLESASLGKAVSALVGKNVATDNGDGTFDVAMRNEADDANLVVVRFNPSTGNKTIVS